jgi:hypothetical protein
VRDARQRLCSDPVPMHGNAPHAELLDAHSLFARLVWHQVRPRERSAADARHRRGSPHGSHAGPAIAGSSCTWGGARSAAITDAALPNLVPASIETLFIQLVRRRLGSPAVQEGSRE